MRLSEKYIRGTRIPIKWVELNGETILPEPLNIISGQNRLWALRQLNLEAEAILRLATNG